MNGHDPLLVLRTRLYDVASATPQIKYENLAQLMTAVEELRDKMKRAEKPVSEISDVCEEVRKKSVVLREGFPAHAEISPEGLAQAQAYVNKMLQLQNRPWYYTMIQLFTR